MEMSREKRAVQRYDIRARRAKRSWKIGAELEEWSGVSSTELSE